MFHSRFKWLSLSVIFSAAAFAQGQATVAETGAVTFGASGGWTFGLPAVRALASVPGVGTAISPDKRTLVAPGFNVGVRAWRFLVPFMDFAVIDTGKAYAQVGSFRSDAQASTYSLHGGLRLIGSRSRIRPFAEFGGGVLHQNLKGTFSVSGDSTSATGHSSLGSILCGGGLQFFAGRKWGSEIAFDGYHLTGKMTTGGQNYSRIRLGIFYQTKSAVE
ncbi:MAG TPA: hypothetical protein VFA33_24550 [Bryobacteraceae bacterium]|nr:hypothetical protein [Bryobacteraceae bacterium]